MSDEELVHTSAPSLGIRQGADRRRTDRRRVDRLTPDRRRRNRRLATMRSLLFSALTFAVPHYSRPKPADHRLPRVHRSDASDPQVQVSITSFEPIRPERAYDHLIREAAARYGLKPALIRSVIRMESGFD